MTMTMTMTMTKTMSTPGEPTALAATPVLALGPEVTIAYAAELRETLLAAATAAAAADSDLLLDLGGVSDFDSSGVQLLLSARLSLQARGHALRLVACSAAVRDALHTFGLADLLAPAPSRGKD